MKTMYFEPVIEFVRRRSRHSDVRLEGDLERLRRGEFPTADDLTGAPTLDRWLTLFLPPLVVQLTGHVEGHPIRRNGILVTSPLCAIDCESFRWARTAGRFYRLLQPLRGVRFDD